MSKIEDITSAQFAAKVLQAGEPVVVDFWAPWCGPCRRLAPVLDELADELADKVRIVKVNTDENPDLPGKYGIMSIPTLLLFKGGTEAARLVGALPKAEIRQRIEAAL